jgi:hypothetical protein
MLVGVCKALSRNEGFPEESFHACGTLSHTSQAEPRNAEPRPFRFKGNTQGRAMTVTNMDVQHPAPALKRCDGLSAIASLRHHWPEYLMEVGEVGLYLFVACAVATLIAHPASIVRQSVSSSIARRALMGLVMGVTAIAM